MPCRYILFALIFDFGGDFGHMGTWVYGDTSVPGLVYALFLSPPFALVAVVALRDLLRQTATVYDKSPKLKTGMTALILGIFYCCGLAYVRDRPSLTITAPLPLPIPPSTALSLGSGCCGISATVRWCAGNESSIRSSCLATWGACGAGSSAGGGWRRRPTETSRYSARATTRESTRPSRTQYDSAGQRDRPTPTEQGAPGSGTR